MPLVGAAGRGDEAKIKELLDKGEAIDQVNADRRTPLFCAVVERQTGVAKLLIDRGADVNKRNAAGDSPLLWAADKGNAELVQALLAKGADPNLLSDTGHGPLFRAIANAHPELALELIAAGADVTTDTRLDFETACEITLEMHRRGTAPPVPGWPTTTARDADTQTFLTAKAQVGKTTGSAATWLSPGTPSDRCANGTKTPIEHVTPLLAATYRFMPTVVRALLDKGASPQVLALDRYSPLYIAALLGDDESVRALLDHGALADAPPAAGVSTPWEAACLGGHLTTARLVGQSVWEARGLSGEVPAACPLSVTPSPSITSSRASVPAGSPTTRR